MPRTKVGDIRVYYEVNGRGFPLLMITGMNENLDCWDPRLIEALSSEFRLILFDNRGAGRTEVSDREYSMKMLADDAAGLLGALAIPKSHVLGISMGGMVAQELAINHPEKVSRLVLCSTASRWNPSEEASRIESAWDRNASLGELVEIYLSFPFVRDYPIDVIRKDPSVTHTWTAAFVRDNPDFVNRYQKRFSEHAVSALGASRQFAAVKRHNTEDMLRHIRAPTLVVHGRHDFALPPENGRILAEAVPNAKFVLFEKSAHYLAEEMEDVADTILEFLLK
jgi:pimeloyl-ACP methyl ester carboxylesterase